MKDICELCSLCSPNMGCTKLKNESCLKEAIKLIKPSVTNGEVIQNIFPGAKILYIDEWEDYNNTHSLYKKAWVKVDFGHGEVLGFSLEWWNRKWGEA